MTAERCASKRLQDDEPCGEPAAVIIYATGAPGWEKPEANCERCARIFRRMIERHYAAGKVIEQQL